jgi:hypothetical protein
VISLRYALVLPLALAAAPAIAETTAPAGNAPPAAAPAKKVCKPIAATGSHLRKRICHTPAEWAEFDKTTGDAAEQNLERRRLPTGGGGQSLN